ncbi:PCYCGC motif-containing (lipo)protein [Paenibacillus rigui]|uniref:Lipoprotein n=1 Tax=Paenibacillus rigui TaxID=554312 RepID=A0A229UW58_9BACL|nr:PCYCGC motif-containing (lipo)protein [Paenibacillus rigui]OXM87365.1 hypothetical protein CF651_06200 [Paenibacillus rigui]
MRQWTKYLVIPCLLLTITACGSKPASHEHEAHQLANGDIQETTKSVQVLPSFLDKKDPQMKQIYQLAASHADLLQWIPCYCGCGESAGHQSNQNCFVKEIRQDGSVVWDDHGTRCNVCLEIAVYSVKMKQEGKTDKEIRSFIDSKYQKGYASPTKTPMPA